MLASRNSACANPSRSRSRVALATCSSVKSTPTTRPEAPTWRAAQNASVPEPEPRSSTSVSSRQRGEVEVVADPRKGGQGLGGYRIEQLARIPEAQRELPPDREMECGVLLAGDLAIHLLHLRLEHLTVDEGAGVRLRQRRRQGHLVLGSDRISTHVDLLPGEFVAGVIFAGQPLQTATYALAPESAPHRHESAPVAMLGVAPSKGRI